MPTTQVSPDVGDLPATVTHPNIVPNVIPFPSESGHVSHDIHQQGATPALSLQIDTIRELHRQRDDLLRAEMRLTLQIKAICRRACGGDKKQAAVVYKAIVKNSDDEFAAAVGVAAMRLLQSRALISELKKEIEKSLVAEAKKLPVAAFVEAVNGFGYIGLAQIVGEAGDLANYANPAKLWKRFGLALINGERQRRCKDKELALQHGFSPRRRATMFVLSDSLMKKAGPYRDLYLERKAYEAAKAPDMAPMAHHKRALRYIAKRLLRELWKAWRAVPQPAP